MSKKQTTKVEQPEVEIEEVKDDPFASMSAFVDPEARVPIRDDYKNTVWIRQKMGLSVFAKVQKELASVEFALTPEGEVDRTHATARMSPKQRRLIMLQANVLDWSGPAFERTKVYKNGNEKIEPIPYDPSLIDSASEHPIWDLVYDKINKLNSDAPILEGEGDEMLDPKVEE